MLNNLEQKIRLPYPHLGQRTVRKQAKRFNWLSAGRRWRKTTLVMAIVVESAAKQGGQYVWGAPTFDQVRVGYNETRHACGHMADFNQSRMTVTFPRGGTIYYRSLDDPDNARGLTANGVVIDECADVVERAWQEVLRPMLIDTNGWAWGIGTPKGRNWFYREHVNALDREDTAAWQAPTLGVAVEAGKLIRKPHPLENPFIPFDEIERLFQTLPEMTFQQEILANFIEGEGSVFRNIPACMHAPLNASPDDHSTHTLVAGLDWGKQNDFTFTSIGCVQCRCEVARDRFNKIDYSFQRDRLKVIYNKWRVKQILAESNSIGEPNLEMLQREGFPVIAFQTTAQSKPPLIENMALAFERAEWQFQQDAICTAELEAYERTVSPTTGRSTYSAPEGLHDDTVIGRALMLRAAEQASIRVLPNAIAAYGSRNRVSSRGDYDRR